jgi:tRNA A-37 threonylcarbamoyl transferase component Bud32
MLERAYFRVCRVFGWLLRATTYSEIRVVDHDGVVQVRKRRRVYAPVLVALGDPLVWALNTGVRVLNQRDWAERERLIYGSVYGTTVEIESDGTLALPHLAGKTLASVLDDPTLGEAARLQAVELAVVALGAFHAKGFTHGDAMAENVMVDRDARVARWFDFETTHEASRSMEWRRADDLRALLATALVRTRRGEMPESVQLILDTYADLETARLVVPTFTSVWQRPLTFYLGQAPLSFRRFREIGRLLRELVGE